MAPSFRPANQKTDHYEKELLRRLKKLIKDDITPYATDPKIAEAVMDPMERKGPYLVPTTPHRAAQIKDEELHARQCAERHLQQRIYAATQETLRQIQARKATEPEPSTSEYTTSQTDDYEGRTSNAQYEQMVKDRKLAQRKKKGVNRPKGTKGGVLPNTEEDPTERAMEWVADNEVKKPIKIKVKNPATSTTHLATTTVQSTQAAQPATTTTVPVNASSTSSNDNNPVNASSTTNNNNSASHRVVYGHHNNTRTNGSS